MTDEQGYRAMVEYSDGSEQAVVRDSQPEAQAWLREQQAQHTVSVAAVVPEAVRAETRRREDADRAELADPAQLDWSAPLEAAEKLCTWDYRENPREWRLIEQRLDQAYDRTVLVLAMRLVHRMTSMRLLPEHCDITNLGNLLRGKDPELDREVFLMSMPVAEPRQDRVDALIRSLSEEHLIQLGLHADSVVTRNAVAALQPGEELTEMMSQFPVWRRLKAINEDA